MYYLMMMKDIKQSNLHSPRTKKELILHWIR